MCGIAGMMVPLGHQIDVTSLHAMTDSLEHRGPDGDGFYTNAHVGFGHRRLSILDLEGGKQPMLSSDKDYVITFNGEIYNFMSLRQELEDLGHRFITDHSDTEVLLHAYMEWGCACVDRLRGMFAFAIWDTKKNELFAARDRLGIKPFYYSILPSGMLVFASELKAILANASCRRMLRVDALEDYLALGYIPDPKSLVEGVSTLPPAAHMIVRLDKALAPTLSLYWHPDIPTGQFVASDAGELVERLEEAVKLRMIADVPLGAFLSGGVDSSAVVGLMSKNSSGSVETCAIGSDTPAYDESEYADTVSKLFNTNHRLKLVSPVDVSLIDQLAGVYDDPFADLSALPTYRVCALAREKVKVALSGDGGDELFAGYRRYKFHMYEERLRQSLPLGVRRAIFGPLAALYPKLDKAPQFLRAKSTFEALSYSSVEAYCHSVSKTPDRERKRLHSAKMTQLLGGYHPKDMFEDIAKDVEGADPLSVAQYLDLKTYLPGDILTKVDRVSMAHSLEVRVPILDHKFVEYAMHLPADIRIVEGESKAVFKTALKGLLPDSILYRQKKGFIVPVVDWLRNELAADVRKLENSETLLETGLFSQEGISSIVSEHLSRKRDHHTTIWSLMMLERSLANLKLEVA